MNAQLNKLFSSCKVKDILAIAAGALVPLAFAPFNLFPLAIISPACLLALWLNTSAGRAFWRGFLFGLGMFGAGVYWVFISIHTYGNTDAAIAFIITAGFVSILALFPAITGSLLNRFFPYTNATKTLCAFPAIWVLTEWVRSWICSGFPWLLLGYSQIHSPLKGYAPIFSVYGVSLMILISSGLLVNMALRYKYQEYKALLLNLVALILIWSVGAGLSLITWTHPQGKPTQISLIQGNIPQLMRWSPDAIEPTLMLYKSLTAKNWASKIIIWPEAAVPVPYPMSSNFLHDISDRALAHDVAVITGVPIKAPYIDKYFNAVMVLGDGMGVYLKLHLVPFGEYLPLEKWLRGLIGFFDIPMSDFIPGSTQPMLLTAKEVHIAAFVCYEIAYAEQVRAIAEHAGVLLTVSNDAWFGRSIASAQHLEIAQMRALETGRPSLMVSNNGITAFISPTGRILAAAPTHEVYVLTSTLQPMTGSTPWVRWNLDPLFLIIIGLLLVAWRRHRT